MPHDFADWPNIARLYQKWQESFVDFFGIPVVVKNTPFECRPLRT
jgi:hypothetical protein